MMNYGKCLLGKINNVIYNIYISIIRPPRATYS